MFCVSNHVQSPYIHTKKLMWQVGDVLIEAGSLIQAGSPIQAGESRAFVLIVVLEVLQYKIAKASV